MSCITNLGINLQVLLARSASYTKDEKNVEIYYIQICMSKDHLRIFISFCNYAKEEGKKGEIYEMQLHETCS